MKTIILLLMRCAILLIAICGLIACLWWYPLSTLLQIGGFWGEPLTMAQNMRFWIQLIFYWGTSLPCFALLCICWIMSAQIKSKGFFTLRTVKMFKISTYILSIDLVIFLLGNVIFYVLGWNNWFFIYLILFAVGIVVAIGFFILSYYARKGCELREENESFI